MQIYNNHSKYMILSRFHAKADGLIEDAQVPFGRPGINVDNDFS
jgi:hypothetical protein